MIVKPPTARSEAERRPSTARSEAERRPSSSGQTPGGQQALDFAPRQQPAPPALPPPPAPPPPPPAQGPVDPIAPEPSAVDADRAARQVPSERLRPPPPSARSQPAPASASEPTVYAVSEIVKRVNNVLTDRFASVWIEGEIDSFKRQAPSGHLYFVLKDSGAALSAMMPRLRAQRVRFPLQNGMKIRARGKLGLFEAQGRFQLYIEEVVLTGEGELLHAFEELKLRLQREGLFAKERKRPLPRFPQRIGLATSPSGAAITDILRVGHRRGRVWFLLAPCLVQGDSAPQQICAAIELLQPHVDVIIVGRGGGSSADLWAFNDEQLARTIARSRVPIVSAVGHEIDFTIADFVADVRAATPSAAAEIVVPEFTALELEIADLEQRLLRAGQRAIEGARQRLDSELARGEAVLQRQIAVRRKVLAKGIERLSAQHPRARLLRDRAALDLLRQRLLVNCKAQIGARDRAALESVRQQLLVQGREVVDLRRRAFEGAVGTLDALSPLRVLLRGYSLARDQQGHVLTDAAAVRPGELVDIRLSQGELTCSVVQVRPPAADGEAQPGGPADPAAGGTPAPVTEPC